MKRPDAESGNIERSRVMLHLLESVERNGSDSQRERASEFGVALGLVNAYLNYCVKKGLIRVKKIPAKRYAYYLTPKGFAEKSRIAITLISSSFRSFRQARDEYCDIFNTLKNRGHRRVVLIGMSELAEISTICATESGIALAAIIDRDRAGTKFGELDIVATLADVSVPFDAAVITDLNQPQVRYGESIRALGLANVLAPTILGITRAVSEPAR